MTEEKFINYLKTKNIFLSNKQIKQFQQYFILLEEWNKKINLTTIIKKEEVYEKHFLDSLTIAFNIDFSKKSLCDIGTGAGFPCIPIKIVFPDLKITALDSTNKKIIFLKTVIKELNLEKIEVINERAEDYAKNNREKYDYVTARAVARLNILMELSTALIKVGGKFIALKGPLAPAEIEETEETCKILKLELIEKQKVVLPSTLAKRYNLIYEKKSVTPKDYPREYNKIKRNPL